MIITIKSTPANVAGMGPVAWNRDEQALSMHPPLPEHIEYVEEYMAQHEHEQAHQIIYRRDLDNEGIESMVFHRVQKEDFQRTPHPHLNHMLEQYKEYTKRIIIDPGLHFRNQHRCRKTPHEDA